MTLEVHLLGPPRILRAGVPVPAPRGHKAWVLLAYLLSSPMPVTRGRLAALLFPEAEDPLGALRWNLSELRRLLQATAWDRERLHLTLPPDTLVDIRLLAGSARLPALQLPGLGREFLEGMRVEHAPALATWLDCERRRYASMTEALLREECLSLLAQGSASRAALLAARLVELNPLDEAHHTVLIRSLASAGDGIAAARQVASCRELFRRELGIEPSPALHAAASTSTARPVAPAVSGRAAVRAQIEAGEAAMRAGAIDAGVECLRRAAADADRLRDDTLRADARVALGAALVHAVRGRDEEGAVALHEALAIAEPRHSQQSADACRELGYVEFLRGQYERAMAWVNRGMSHAKPGSPQHCALLTLQGSIHSDTAHYAPALQALAAAAQGAKEAGDDRQRAYALSMIGRVHLLRAELDLAGESLDASMAIARSGWTAFLPWPQSLRAEVDLQRGASTRAADGFDAAFTLGCQFGDPCWEALAGRGRARVAESRGEVESARSLLQDALARSAREPDTYAWTKAYVLDALCGLSVRHRLADSALAVRELQSLASRCGMREMLVRAHLHAASSGLEGYASSAQLLSCEIDNPALRRAGQGSAPGS
ncbi:MAG TPA: BTAD domain-containing putative transcriptional regulator [Ramlibacter sp.]